MKARAATPARRLREELDDAALVVAELDAVAGDARFVGTASRDTDGGMIGSTATALSSLSVDFDADEDERFLLIGVADLVSADASAFAELGPRIDGAVVRNTTRECYAAATATAVAIALWTAPADDNYTAQLYLRSLSAGNVRVDASANRRLRLIVLGFAVEAE